MDEKQLDELVEGLSQELKTKLPEISDVLLRRGERIAEIAILWLEKGWSNGA